MSYQGEGCEIYNYCCKNKLDNTAKAILKLAVVGPEDERSELMQKYTEAIESHNQSVLENPWANSGFDLFVPQETIFHNQDYVNGNQSLFSTAKMVSMNVKAELISCDNSPLAYYMYPRSSISKTPLMLANHVGIIDSGYRGNLIGAFRNLSLNTYTVEKHTRLLQICHPELKPFTVKLVEESELSNTERGEGGFGSTGK